MTASTTRRRSSQPRWPDLPRAVGRLAVLAPALALLPAAVQAQSQPQPTPCFRWSGQATVANAKGQTSGNGTTLYYFGGEAQTSSGQDSNTWTNALVSLSLGDDWATGTPPLTLVEADTGNYSYPPAVTLGALWPSADGNYLYQYGGSYSDSPSVPPPEQRTFQYDIQGGAWSVVDADGDIGNVAEGQPALVPGMGTNGENVGFYSHGHQDDHTTEGWSNQISRIYLNTMVSFDMGNKKMTNITSYSSSAHTSNSSTPLTNPVSRADGTLTYVPGLGTDGKGILVSIGGATETEYVDNSVLDIFDLGSQGWTRQSTGGQTMDRRVNHCTVRGSATVNGVDAHHLFVYGGQRLNQTDRDSAMWILTIMDNEYTWTSVGDSLSGQPPGRAGHQCVINGNQLVVMGGLTSDDVICEQPGVFVYNVSDSAWSSSFKANTVFTTPDIVANITGGTGSGDPSSSSSGGKTNIGAIVGGVVGGVVGLLLILGAIFFFLWRKKKQRVAEDKANAEKKALAGGSDSGSSGGRFAGFAFPGEKHRTQGSVGSEFPPSSMYEFQRRQSGFDQAGPASDDVETEMLGRDTYVASGLAPRRELRVVNADDD
ncbi:hypothetical protein JCM8097_003264 [Rhodosporidiobolus ruineniae]